MDIAVYHTQQCAEKALKAFIVFSGKEVRRVHNLRILLEECSKIESSLDDLYEDCIYLDPYATLYRYPEGDLMLGKQEVEDAVKAAERILKKIVEVTDK